MRNIFNIAALLLLIGCMSSSLSAQTVFQEYLVSVDPVQGTFSIINSLPGVAYIQTGLSGSGVDEVHHRYFFLGVDSNGANRFYTVDATTGNILYQPLISLPASADNVGQLCYDNTLQKLFGISWNSTLQKEFFISLDEVTGTITYIDSISAVQFVSIGMYSYDQRDHVYFFQGNSSLFSIQAPTGAILASPTVPTLTYNSIRYDNSTHTLYANLQGALVKVDPATAAYTASGTVPNIQGVVTMPNGVVFDDLHQRYVFEADDNTATHLYSIDTLAAVIHAPVFPQGLASGENLIELEIDNSNGNLYALHWGAVNVKTDIHMIGSDQLPVTCFPNPFSTTVTFSLPTAYPQSLLTIHNTTGQVVRSEHNSGQQIMMNRNDMSAGMYFYTIEANGTVIGKGKIVLE